MPTTWATPRGRGGRRSRVRAGASRPRRPARSRLHCGEEVEHVAVEDVRRLEVEAVAAARGLDELRPGEPAGAGAPTGARAEEVGARPPGPPGAPGTWRAVVRPGGATTPGPSHR